MKKINSIWQNSIIKVCIISVVALLMLIPLYMIRKQVNERSYHHSESVNDITKNWGAAQTFTGPWISYQYKVAKNAEAIKASLSPDSLKYVVNSVSRELHRLIYDVSVYTADLTIKGNFVLYAKLCRIGKCELSMCFSSWRHLLSWPGHCCSSSSFVSLWL